MFSLRNRRIAVAGLASLALVLAGCSSDGGDTATTTSAAETSATTQSAASLADWEGTWASLGAYATLPEMQPYAEEAAAEHGETLEEVLAEVEEDRATDFAGMVIDADRIVFVDTLDELDSASAADGYEYTFVEAQDVDDGEHQFTWYIFEGGDGASPAYVLLMELHGEETLAHFHMRYGDTLDEALNADDHWYPTFVDPTEATDEQIAETLFHHHH